MSTGVAQKRQPVLLVVEDDRDMRSLICDELWDLGMRVVEAADGDEAMQKLNGVKPDLILTDLRMPAGGMDHVLRLRTMAPGCPIIVMTAFGDATTRGTALKCGAAAYFDKPVRMVELKASIRELLGNHRKESE
jgi:DNA-binding response OmpR family regulator